MGNDGFPSEREGGGYGEIGLVEVVWNVCAVVVDFRIKMSVTLHGELHGFRAVRGTSTATLEETLAQKLVGMALEPLFQVILDVQKAYYSLDRGQCMEIVW